MLQIYLSFFHIIKLFNCDCNCLVGDGRLGYPDRAPYNAIHVGAAAKELPQAVSEMLKLFSDVLGILERNILRFIVDRSISTWWTFSSANGPRELGSNLSANR